MLGQEGRSLKTSFLFPDFWQQQSALLRDLEGRGSAVKTESQEAFELKTRACALSCRGVCVHQGSLSP